MSQIREVPPAGRCGELIQETSGNNVPGGFEIRLPFNFRRFVPKTVPHSLKCVPGHVRAAVTGSGFTGTRHDTRHGNERVPGRAFVERVDHIRFGGHKECLRLFESLRILPHGLRPANEEVVRLDVPVDYALFVNFLDALN